jgi:hypothetical protein
MATVVEGQPRPLEHPSAERAARGGTAGAPDPRQLGVIEDARRRRDARRTRAFVTVVLGLLLGAVAWALLAGGSRGSSLAAKNPAHLTATVSSAYPVFNIRVWPALGVGRAGWCMVVEEHGHTGGSACGPPVTMQAPSVWGFGFGAVGRPATDRQFGVVGPEVAGVLVGKNREVRTVTLPGLPYGLRAFRVTGAHTPGREFVPLDKLGRQIRETWTVPATPATVSWHSPAAAPPGPCALRAARIPARALRRGTVVAALSRFPGQLIGHAFLPCIASEYRLHATPLKAILLLDAAHPQSVAAALPDFHPVRSEPGIFAEGGLSAKRAGPGWLVVEQGRSPAERSLLLRRLTASVRG